MALVKKQASAMEKAEKIGEKVAQGLMSEDRAKRKLHQLTTRLMASSISGLPTDESYKIFAEPLRKSYLRGFQRHAKKYIQNKLRQTNHSDGD